MFAEPVLATILKPGGPRRTSADWLWHGLVETPDLKQGQLVSSAPERWMPDRCDPSRAGRDGLCFSLPESSQGLAAARADAEAG